MSPKEAASSMNVAAPGQGTVLICTAQYKGGSSCQCKETFHNLKPPIPSQNMKYPKLLIFLTICKRLVCIQATFVGHDPTITIP